MRAILHLDDPDDVRELLLREGLLREEHIDEATILAFMREYCAVCRTEDFNLTAFVNDFCERIRETKRENAGVFGSLVPATAPMPQTALSLPTAAIPAYANPPLVPYAQLCPEIFTVTPPVTRKGGKASHSPHEAAQILLRQVPFAAVGDALYAFNGGFYTLMTPTMAKRLIMASCWTDVSERGNAEIISQILELVNCNPLIVVEGLRPDPRFVTFANGLLQLDDFRMSQHTPSVFDTSMVSVEFSAERAPNCPNFDRFLDDIAAGEPRLIDRLWEVMGYLLTNDTSGKCFFVMQGVPDSGKSILGRFIASFFSPEAVTSVDIGSLGQRFALAELVGKKLNTSLDLPSGLLRSDAVSCIKQITGGDLMTADIKFFPRAKFFCSCRLLYATNHAVRLCERDTAFFERLVVLPFRVSIPKSRQNPQLLASFEPERNAICNKALAAYTRLRQRGYIFSGDFRVNEVCDSVQSRSETVDVDALLRNFLAKRCVFGDAETGEFTADLYAAFCDFAGDSSVSITDFSRQMLAMCGDRICRKRWRAKDGNGNPQGGFRGISLRVACVGGLTESKT